MRIELGPLRWGLRKCLTINLEMYCHVFVPHQSRPTSMAHKTLAVLFLFCFLLLLLLLFFVLFILFRLFEIQEKLCNIKKQVQLVLFKNNNSLLNAFDAILGAFGKQPF